VTYDPGMIRSLTLLIVAVALPFAPAADVARAEPPSSPCRYTLSPPHVVQVSGTSVVTATLSPAGCDQATAYQTVACIQRQGSDGPGRCEQNGGLLTARVYYAPYQPGATYVATGRGCASTGNPPQPFCQPMGPLTATL
jgi:hypothetical protein